jgi:phage shock protein A
MTVLWILGGITVALMLFQRRNLRRILIAAGAQFGKVSRWIWSKDVVAIYQAEIDRSADEIREINEGLERYKGLVTRLQRQVANNEKEVDRLTQKVRGFLTDGNEEKAAEYAVQLKKAQLELIENKLQLKTYDDTYQNSLKKVKFANERIRQARDKAEKLQADLRMSRVEAETAKLAQSFNVKTSSLDSLGEVEDEIQRQIDSNRAKGIVIRDLSQDGTEELEEEENRQTQEAKLVLEEMKKEMNLLPIDVQVKHVEKNPR